MSCSPVASTSALKQASTSVCPRIRHLVSGTFNSPFLHLLSFDTLTRSLSLLSTIPGYGPHSFLAVGRTNAADPNKVVDTLYATTWAKTPELCAWRIQWQNENIEGLQWLGNVPITATSSYVHVQPPPYSCLTTPCYGVTPSTSKFLFSAGGPTGEVHSLDPLSGAIKAKEQEIIFLKGGKKDLAAADKTRKALRYGAHSVDIGLDKLAYIADVGRNSILMYLYDSDTGFLELLSETHSQEKHDGPRHVVPSWTGKHVFMVTEHTSFVDVYRVESSQRKTLKHLQRVSVLPPGLENKNYRGDTVRLSPDGRSLFATTRGMTTSQNGFIKVWNLDEDASDNNKLLTEKLTYETRNSGGKAHAIEFAPRYGQIEQTVDFAVFTDDQEGHISVLEWNGTDLQDVATIKLPPLDDGEAQGASQAVWLS